MSTSEACPACGAVLPKGAEQCSLCGTPVATSGAEPSSPPASQEAPAAPSAAAETGAFCNDCGWQNPPGANFCSRCGSKLQALAEGDTRHAVGGTASGGASPSGTKPAAGPETNGPAPHSDAPAPETTADRDDDLKQRVALVVGVAVLLVAGLYGWSAWSGNSSANETEPAVSAGSNGSPPAMSGGSAGSARGNNGGSTRSGGVPAVIERQQGGDVPASIAAQADSLQNVIDTRDGQRRRLARRELGSLFAGAGLTERAAAQQWQLAQEAGDDPEAWERAGSLLYDWMASLNRDDRAQAQERAQVARVTVDAYERVLESDPENYDVRTNLAIAYLDTNNPMRGISEIRRVLEERPDHVGARFNYGLMQVMIGRNATAVEQFERVRETASEDSPYYQQASQIIERINTETDGDPQDAPTPGAENAPPAAGMPPAGS